MNSRNFGACNYFRLERPWCAANPVADLALLGGTLEKLPSPIVQIDGKLSNSSANDQDLNSEIIFELHFQAFADQIFGNFSPEAANTGAIEALFWEIQKSGTVVKPGYGMIARGSTNRRLPARTSDRKTEKSMVVRLTPSSRPQEIPVVLSRG